MRSALHMFLAAVMVCTLGRAVCVADVIRTDPNTPSVAAVHEQPGDFWADPRLAQPVTYEALKKPVRDILDDLTNLTGVKLNPGYNANDWQVRDRRMVVIAKDLPLRDLMQSIARVMKFQWSRTERDGAWTYRLWMDRRTLLGEESQRYREEQRETEYINNQRGKLLDIMDKSSQFTEEELAEMKESDPYSYALVKSGVGAAMGDLMRAVPEVRQGLQNVKEMSIRSGELSAEAQEALAKLAKASGRMDLYRREPGSEAGPASVSDYPERVSVRLNEMVDALDPGEPLRRCLLGDMRISTYGPPDSEGVVTSSGDSHLFLTAPDSSVGQLYGTLVDRVMNGETSLDTARTEFDQQGLHLWMKENASSDWGEALAEHPEDPDLERVVKFGVPQIKLPDGTERERKCCEDICRTLVKGTGMSVVSDFFFPPTSYSPSPGPWKSEARIIDALTYIEENYISNWWRHGNVIEVRDRYWFRKRGVQIPDAWIERWAKECDRKGVIEIDSLAQICSLTEEQFRYNFQYTMGWSHDFFIKGLNVAYEDDSGGPVMRFYASLDQYQRGALLQGGLDTRTLSEAQWEKLGQADAKLQPGAVASVVAHRYDYQLPLCDGNGKEISSEREVGYRFTGYAEDGSRVWDAWVPLPWKWERKSKT